MVLDAHTDGVDEDSDHDASVEVFALHDSPKLPRDVMPDLLASLLSATALLFLCTFLAFIALLLGVRVRPLPVRFLHSPLL